MEYNWQDYFSQKPCGTSWKWLCDQLDAGLTLVEIARVAAVDDRCWAGRSAHANDVLQTLATDEYWGVRWSVAENPNTPVDVLQTLATDEDRAVRRGVAENPNTPVDGLQTLATDEDWAVRRGVARNLNTPSVVR